MSEQKVNFNLPEIEGNEIILRTGQAAPAFVPSPLKLLGRFHAPAEYIAKRKSVEGVIIPQQTYAVFDYDAATITLVVNEFQRNPTTVTGLLKKIDFLAELGVNTKAHSNKSLLGLIKFKGHYFADPTEHKSLIKALMKFEVQTESRTVDANDRNGSKESLLLVQAKTELAGKQINLRVPIFEGYQPIDLQLTIEIEPQNNSVVLYLVNEAFEGLIDEVTRKLFDEQRPIFEEYVIIDK